MEVKFTPKDTEMKTRPVRGFMIVTRNGSGEPYVIEGEYLHDLVDDWEASALVCPPNDERVLFFMFDGEAVNPYEYTDFESVIHWMKAKLGEEVPF